ncbi:hypothetical protein AB0C12_26515 [Actinoplanes sp. NPDC048967]|uniref:hypothetical protein n=1 Tax=Actinoplanes sp. NPDC048967 TaxID=3155269 RepID=UPI0033D65602
MDLRNRDQRRRAVLFRIVCEIRATLRDADFSAAINNTRVSPRSVINDAQSEVGGNDQPDHHQQPVNALSCCSSDIPAHGEPPLDHLPGLSIHSYPPIGS